MQRKEICQAVSSRRSEEELRVGLKLEYAMLLCSQFNDLEQVTAAVEIGIAGLSEAGGDDRIVVE